MSDWFAVLVLGLIEGVTEFLPVSSTGHLLLAEHWLGHKTELFNVVIQTGAVLAVLAVFAGRAKELLLGWNQPANRDYLLKLGVAFVITAIGGLALKKAGLKLPKETAPIAWATLIGGVLFVAAERWLRGRKTTETVSWAIALAVGGAQLIAVAFPGSSRSGTTILLALLLGLSRSAATEFSFLLGIPTLLAAGGEGDARCPEGTHAARAVVAHRARHCGRGSDGLRRGELADRLRARPHVHAVRLVSHRGRGGDPAAGEVIR